jgi:tRNA G10  N-methylase Trm11
VIETREQWRAWVTPKPLRSAPVHRWYAFPHSFTGDLVGALIDEWGLIKDDRLADPFVGAGTTALAARLKGVPATGFDLSPFAVFVTRVKLGKYNAARAGQLWEQLESAIRSIGPVVTNLHFADLIKKALPPGILGTFVAIKHAIDHLPTSTKYKDLFHLALLAVIPRFSRAIATGGWLKWVENRTRGTGVRKAMATRVQEMLADIRSVEKELIADCDAIKADARRLPVDDEQFSAVITSPPYPNRHDYTRVFGVELMFGFLNWEQTRDLRYQTIHSHPEARPERPNFDDYQPPRELVNALARMRRADLDLKILEMLAGYFIDMHLCLRECRRVVVEGGRIAFVVGNAQYRGVPVRVDEMLGEIGSGLGLQLEKIIAVRLRGNSAQQMGEFGRKPSRESVVVFRKRLKKK